MRTQLALPLRYGGLGIQNPVDICEEEYAASIYITEELTNLIISQDPDIKNLDSAKIKYHTNITEREKVQRYTFTPVLFC